MSTVLVLSDFTGRSRVGMRMLLSALESRGHDVLALPTALISNTLDLGRHVALDTTDYLQSALEVWLSLGVHWDFAMIGYVTGLAQARALCDVADNCRARGAFVLVDPILADDGKMYHDVTGEQVEGMRLLVDHADLVTPNETEARLLTDLPIDAPSEEALSRLLSRGRSVLITGAHVGDGKDAVLGFDAGTRARFTVPFERVPGRHFGTGDLFCALLADGLLRGMSLERAAKEASDAVGREILRGARGSLPPPVHAL